jgi:hypothetical protein
MLGEAAVVFCVTAEGAPPPAAGPAPGPRTAAAGPPLLDLGPLTHRRRRNAALHSLSFCLTMPGRQPPAQVVLRVVSDCAGTAMGTRCLESNKLVGMNLQGKFAAIAGVPSEVALLQLLMAGNDEPPPEVEEEPLMMEVWRRRSCFTCGRLPDALEKEFNYCSLCRDPAAGRFCCKEPCFREAWKKGHKEVCAGRDKGKDKKKGG